MPTPVRASNQARATPACPRSTGTRGRTLTMSTMEVNFIAAICYSLQHANFKVQLASMRRATCKTLHIQHATNKHGCSHATHDSFPTSALMLIAFFGPLNVVGFVTPHIGQLPRTLALNHWQNKWSLLLTIIVAILTASSSACCLRWRLTYCCYVVK
jgi:hypothetical protein